MNNLVSPAWQAFEKGKGKGIGARDRARGRREEGNACKEAIVFAILPTN